MISIIIKYEFIDFQIGKRGKTGQHPLQPVVLDGTHLQQGGCLQVLAIYVRMIICSSYVYIIIIITVKTPLTNTSKYQWSRMSGIQTFHYISIVSKQTLQHQTSNPIKSSTILKICQIKIQLILSIIANYEFIDYKMFLQYYTSIIQQKIIFRVETYNIYL